MDSGDRIVKLELRINELSSETIFPSPCMRLTEEAALLAKPNHDI